MTVRATQRLIIGAFLQIAMIATVTAALDLTATSEEYVNSGIIYKRLVFKDGPRRVEMELPQGWTFRVIDSGRLELSQPEKRFAAAVIQTKPKESSIADEAAVKALAQEALAGVPPGSQAATVEQTRVEPDGTESEVTVSYKNLGYTFRRSIRLVDRPQCRLMLQVSAPEAEFPAANVAVRRMIQSLNWN